MDQLPDELLHQILRACIQHATKSLVIRLRLVCMAFDRILRPYFLQTLWLDFPRLNKSNRKPQPRMEVLQSIGTQCTSLNINLMLVRDEFEVDELQAIFGAVPRMMDYSRDIMEEHCMKESTFTELDFFHTLSIMLLSCPRVERLALNLPFLMLGRRSSAATRILANAFKALALRSPEDSAQLKVLVIENLTDSAICHLWTNPIDVKNIVVVLSTVEHLVISLRRLNQQPHAATSFGTYFWSFIQRAGQLTSLCIIGANIKEPPRGLRRTRSWRMPRMAWASSSLPRPLPLSSNLTRLELKCVDVSGDLFHHLVENLGPSLEELYLNEVYLKIEQPEDPTTIVAATTQVLWIGLPNQRPAQNCRWIATMVRCGLPRLRICRASFLGYDLYTITDEDDEIDDIIDNNNETDDDDNTGGGGGNGGGGGGVTTIIEFDFIDPCGLGRSVAQRFVEVAMGFRQPNSPKGEPIEYLPPPTQEAPGKPLKERPPIGVTDYDANAHQIMVCNTTSRWKQCIDDCFPNASVQTFQALKKISATVRNGFEELEGGADDDLDDLPLVDPEM